MTEAARGALDAWLVANPGRQGADLDYLVEMVEQAVRRDAAGVVAGVARDLQAMAREILCGSRGRA